MTLRRKATLSAFCSGPRLSIASAAFSRAQRTRPTQTTPGGIIAKEAPLHISNVAHIDPDSGAATRVGYEVKDGKKVRVARASGKALD